MHCSAYGLGISASGPIPRLAGAPAAHGIDLRIELNQRPPWFDPSRPASARYTSAYCDHSGAPALRVTELEAGALRLHYTDGVEFFIDGAGTEIWADWRPEVLTIDEVSSYLLGPVMGLALCLRGRICLHASGVVIDGRAVALVGPPGAGKSTTAAAFGAFGHGVLSDDIVTLTDTGPKLLAHPGYPRLRLWPESLAALAELGTAVPALPAGWGQQRYHLDISREDYAFQTAALPLAAVYVLAPRSTAERAPFVEPLPGNQALMALVANTFAGRLLDRAMRAREFDVFSRIATSLPVRRLTPHADVRRLPALCDAVLSDMLTPV